MQPALAPAMHNIRPGQDSTEQNVQQALLMAQGHSLVQDTQAQHPAVQQTQAMLLDHQQGQGPISDSGADASKRGVGKRELSTSKRAAQNRAAQRAFRQRKEGHIKKLEEQVRDYTALAESYKTVQAENYQLRDYIINLQSRLIESQGDFPQPPGNIDLGARPSHPVVDGTMPSSMEGVDDGVNDEPTDDVMSLVGEAANTATATAASANAAAVAAGVAGHGLDVGLDEVVEENHHAKNDIVDPGLSPA